MALGTIKGRRGIPVRGGVGRQRTASIRVSTGRTMTATDTHGSEVEAVAVIDPITDRGIVAIA